MSKRSKMFDSGEPGTDLGDEAPLTESLASGEPEPPPATLDENTDAKGRPVDEETAPLEGPKATEVAAVPTAPESVEIRHPEIEAAVAPPAVREAPPAPDAVPREPWGTRPTYEELQTAQRALVRTVDERNVGGIFVGGVKVIAQETEVLLQAVRDRGESHLRALASDPAVEVKIVE